MDGNGPVASELTLVLADDDVAMRAGVRCVLETSGFKVVLEANNATEAIEGAIARHPDVCLLAINLPGNAIAATESIREALPDTRIVILTGSHRDEDLFESLRAGADGYLPKTTPADRFASAVRGVMEGEAALPRTLTATVSASFTIARAEVTCSCSCRGVPWS